MKKNIAVAVVFALAGCATDPAKISATSVSPLQYNDYNCKQITAELDRVNTRQGELHTSLKEKADNDSAQMGIGMILFWPALFFLEGGDGPEATEFSRLKGEQEALEKSAIAKECVITQPAPTPKQEVQEAREPEQL